MIKHVGHYDCCPFKFIFGKGDFGQKMCNLVFQWGCVGCWWQEK